MSAAVQELKLTRRQVAELLAAAMFYADALAEDAAEAEVIAELAHTRDDPRLRLRVLRRAIDTLEDHLYRGASR